nr:hypothetical protein BaRGS_022292 [Batillaria attramentaria]
MYVRRRLNTSSSSCKFYTTVIVIISISLLVLLNSLIYVFVLVPSWQGQVLTYDGRKVSEALAHVLAHTQCGPVEGLLEEDVFVFKGIPYALPPEGSRRWQKPVGLNEKEGTCWKGTLQVKQFGSACVQPKDPNNHSSFTGSEDCLFLNVWTRSLDPLAKLPVMVWIHGGDLVFFSGNYPGYSPNPSVTKATGAVYVSMNYRLGPLGFLSLDVLSKESPSGTSGNYGLMDIILVLQWVRDNIRNFGGDPSKVTVFGQSSGGTAIHALLASPLAVGLFHTAWAMSPSSILNKTSSQASRDNAIFLTRTGCDNADCLRSLAPFKLMEGTPWSVFPYWGMEDLFSMPVKGHFDGALPVVDGKVLMEPPLQAWKSGRGIDVPLLLTTTAQEIDLMPFDPTISHWTWPHYRAIVKEQLTPFGTQVAQKALELYPSSSRYSPEFQYTSLVTDIRATCPVHVLANVTSSHFRSPVYRGIVTASPSQPVNAFNISSARYAFHCWDAFTFFGDFGALGFQPQTKDLDFQRMLRQQVITFARDGRPESPVWQTYGTCTALISDHVFPEDHYNRDKCDFWLREGFFSYAWIN